MQYLPTMQCLPTLSLFGCKNFYASLIVICHIIWVDTVSKSANLFISYESEEDQMDNPLHFIFMLIFCSRNTTTESSVTMWYSYDIFGSDKLKLDDKWIFMDGIWYEVSFKIDVHYKHSQVKLMLLIFVEENKTILFLTGDWFEHLCNFSHSLLIFCNMVIFNLFKNNVLFFSLPKLWIRDKLTQAEVSVFLVLSSKMAVNHT